MIEPQYDQQNVDEVLQYDAEKLKPLSGPRLTLLEECLAALAAYSNLDEQRNKCDKCEDGLEQSAEACEYCFPFADDARLKMRAALARAQAERVNIP